MTVIFTVTVTITTPWSDRDCYFYCYSYRYDYRDSDRLKHFEQNIPIGEKETVITKCEKKNQDANKLYNNMISI